MLGAPGSPWPQRPLVVGAQISKELWLLAMAPDDDDDDDKTMSKADNDAIFADDDE